MRVELRDADYSVFLTEDDLRKTCSRSSKITPYHSSLTAPVTTPGGEETGKVMDFAANNQADVIDGPNAFDRISVEHDERGPVVRVFTNRLIDLLEGAEESLGTRYDGHTAKISIQREL